MGGVLHDFLLLSSTDLRTPPGQRRHGSRGLVDLRAVVDPAAGEHYGDLRHGGVRELSL